MKYILSVFVFLFMICVVSGQYSSRNNEAKLDADYYLMTQEYDRALKLYLNILKSEPQNADIKYKIGICYLNSDNEKKTAIPYLEEASQEVSEKYNPNSFKEMNAPIETYFLLGSAYRVDNQLNKSIDAYNSYKALLDPRDEYNNLVVDQYIKSCSIASEMLQRPVNLQTVNLGSTINNEISNFNPVVSGDGQTLVYTSPGRQGYEIFHSTLENGEWTVPKNITSSLGGSNRLLKTSSLSYDGTTLYLVNQDPFDSDIYFSILNRSRWSRAESMDKPINSKSIETHGSISRDGKTMYFTSDRKGGEGDLDIYQSTLDDKGKWSKPVNLGPHINTLFNEETPFVSPDGSTLFFSSEGHDGMGGFDLFSIDLSDPDAKPVNLGYPVNTTDNNYFYVPVDNGSSGYYSMMNDDSYGSQDIYLVEILPSVPASILLSGIIRSDVNIDTLLPASIHINILNTSSYESLDQHVKQDEPGRFSCELPSGNYQITIAAEGFSTYSDLISIPEDYAEPEMELEAFLDYTVKEKKVDNQLIAETSIIKPDNVPSDDDKDLISLEDTNNKTTEELPVVQEKSEIPPDKVQYNPPAASSEEITGEPIKKYQYKAYTMQLMALRKPVDLSYFKGLTDISVTLSDDQWYRYTWGIAADLSQAEALKAELTNRGFNKAFILGKDMIPNFTIQVMAVPGPVVNLTNFKGLSVITATRSTDIFCRYSTGEYETLEDAKAALEKIKQLGYTSAFIRKL